MLCRSYLLKSPRPNTHHCMCKQQQRAARQFQNGVLSSVCHLLEQRARSPPLRMCAHTMSSSSFQGQKENSRRLFGNAGSTRREKKRFFPQSHSSPKQDLRMPSHITTQHFSPARPACGESVTSLPGRRSKHFPPAGQDRQ